MASPRSRSRWQFAACEQHRKFYGDVLGFAEQGWPGGAAFRLGESLVCLEEDTAVTVDPVRAARGWRYITLQVADIDAVHDELRGKGVREVLRRSRSARWRGSR